MIEIGGAEGITGIQSIRVSSEAYSILLVTYKKTESQGEDTKEQGVTDRQFYVKYSKIMSMLLKEVTNEWKKESKELSTCYKMRPRFKWTESSAKDDEDSLESELIGKHDFFHLLRSPWIPELGNFIDKVNKKLREDKRIRTKELIGIPCVAVDFEINGTSFVGNPSKEAWFEKEDPIRLDSTKVHALMFVDLKKGLNDKNRRLSLPDFLDMLVHPESNIISGSILKKTRESIKGLFLGYGIYELIFLLESPSLEDLLVSVTCIRICFKKRLETIKDATVARGSSTMVFMPRKAMMENEEIYRSSKETDYSVMVAIRTGSDVYVAKRIMEIGKEVGIEVFDRQGYYDLIASFKEKSFLGACKIITEIRSISKVLGTSTIIKINERCIVDNFPGEESNDE